MAIAPHGRTATNGGCPYGASAAGSIPASAKTSPVVRIGHGHSSESSRGCGTQAAIDAAKQSEIGTFGDYLNFDAPRRANARTHEIF